MSGNIPTIPINLAPWRGGARGVYLGRAGCAARGRAFLFEGVRRGASAGR